MSVNQTLPGLHPWYAGKVKMSIFPASRTCSRVRLPTQPRMFSIAALAPVVKVNAPGPSMEVHVPAKAAGIAVPVTGAAGADALGAAPEPA